MNKPNVSKILNKVQTAVVKRSPEILTGLGIAGLLTTTVLAVKATPKAMTLIEAAKKEEEKEKLTPAETVKATWKCYVPAATTAAVSVACIIGANSVHTRRTTALAAAYNLSTQALSEYKDKVVETIGEKKEQTIREAVVQDKIEKDPVTKSEVIITDRGSTLCYDAHSGRYFQSDIDCIKRAVNEINRKMVYHEYVSLNEFYDELNLAHTKQGEDLGWRLDAGFVDINFSSHLSDDGRPCMAIYYTIMPRYDYYKMG